jgi:hypothetical protein
MEKSNQRVIGLDVHPNSFAGGIVEGQDPGSARVASTSRPGRVKGTGAVGKAPHHAQRRARPGSQWERLRRSRAATQARFPVPPANSSAKLQSSWRGRVSSA